MCFATLAAIAVSAQAAGAVTGGLAAGAEASYKGQVASNNARIAAQNQAFAAAAGSSQVENAGLRARSQLSETRASFAANNLDVNTGSPADVQTSQRIIGAKDVSTVASDAARQVYGYGAEEANYAAQAKLYESQAPYDIASGFIGAAGDVAGGMADLPGSTPSLSSPSTSTASLGPTQLSGAPIVPEQFQWMQLPQYTLDTGSG